MITIENDVKIKWLTLFVVKPPGFSYVLSYFRWYEADRKHTNVNFIILGEDGFPILIAK